MNKETTIEIKNNTKKQKILIKEQITPSSKTKVYLECKEKEVKITAETIPIYSDEEDDSLIFQHTEEYSDLAIAAAHSSLDWAHEDPGIAGCQGYFGTKSAVYRVKGKLPNNHINEIKMALDNYNAKINKPIEIKQTQFHISYGRSLNFIVSGYVKASYTQKTYPYSEGESTYHIFYRPSSATYGGGNIDGLDIIAAYLIKSTAKFEETVDFILKGGGAHKKGSIKTTIKVTNEYKNIGILSKSETDNEIKNPFSYGGQYVFIGPGIASSLIVYNQGETTVNQSQNSEYIYEEKTEKSGITSYRLKEIKRISKSDCLKIEIPEDVLDNQEISEAKQIGLDMGSTIEVPLSALPSSSIPGLDKLLSSQTGSGKNLKSGASTSCPSGFLVWGKTILPVSTYLRVNNIIWCKSVSSNSGSGSTISAASDELSLNSGSHQHSSGHNSISLSSRSVTDGGGMVYRDISITPSTVGGGPGVYAPVQPKANSTQIVKTGLSKARVTIGLSGCYFLSSSSLQSFGDALIRLMEADTITYSGNGKCTLPGLTYITSASFDHLGPSWSISGLIY